MNLSSDRQKGGQVHPLLFMCLQLNTKPQSWFCILDTRGEGENIMQAVNYFSCTAPNNSTRGHHKCAVLSKCCPNIIWCCWEPLN